MNILYLDPVGGIAGDMFLAALLDGANEKEEKELLENLKKLKLSGWKWKKETVLRGGFRGLHIDFQIAENHTCRHLNDIFALVKAAGFPKIAEEKILYTFDLLAEAEAKVHGMAKEEIHFHEVGAVDTILDISSVCLLLTERKIEKIFCAPLPMGKGTVKCSHGEIPLPAPAVAELLEGAAVRPSDIKGETVTPTGIALLKAFDCTFGEFPEMTVMKSGIGCGTRDSKTPNILRLFSGELKKEPLPQLYRLECTIDDMTGEEFGNVWEHVSLAGARDMYYTPIYMKKGRPAVKVTVLSDGEHLENVKTAIFTHTTTLGMITTPVEREMMNRRFESIETPYGEVTYKIAEGFGVTKVKAEFEDLRRIAEKNGISLREARTAADHCFYAAKEKEE